MALVQFAINIFHRYEAGDHVAVYPQNDNEQVEAIGKILGVDLDEVFALQNVDGSQISLTGDLFYFRGQFQEVPFPLSNNLPNR